MAEPRGIILYLHGNAGSLRSWGAVAPDLVASGYDLLIVDYRGYGQSTGRISGENIKEEFPVRGLDGEHASRCARVDRAAILLT